MVDTVKGAPDQKAKVVVVEMLHILIIFMIVRALQHTDDLLACITWFHYRL